jgi:predicted house-cleaning noncanonical NTP pyrophosphatase (MazG superfamily)
MPIAMKTPETSMTLSAPGSAPRLGMTTRFDVISWAVLSRACASLTTSLSAIGSGRSSRLTGGQPVTRVLDHASYEAALWAKLLEEAHEAQAAPGGQLVSELADMLEVLQALAAAHDMGWEDVVSEASRKRAERGGFDNRIFLEYVQRTW